MIPDAGTRLYGSSDTTKTSTSTNIMMQRNRIDTTTLELIKVLPLDFDHQLISVPCYSCLKYHRVEAQRLTVNLR